MGEPICHACAQQFTSTQLRCQICSIELASTDTQVCALCVHHTLNWNQCACVTNYQYPWSHLIACFKFQQQPQWAKWMAKQMILTPAIAQLILDSDWLIPIPSSTHRLSSRGFQPTWELCKALRTQWVQPHWQSSAQILENHQTTTTTAQHLLSRQARFGNLQHAFHVSPSWVHAIKGQRIVLVDDILTTGMTLDAAAQTLLQAGASQVNGIVFARTPIN
jgi:ComF family protein